MSPALPLPLLVGLVGSIGLAVGSFLNVVVHRLPLGLSVVSPGSACPACGHEVRGRDNVPVLSWLQLRAPLKMSKVEVLLAKVMEVIVLVQMVVVLPPLKKINTKFPTQVVVKKSPVYSVCNFVVCGSS